MMSRPFDAMIASALGPVVVKFTMLLRLTFVFPDAIGSHLRKMCVCEYNALAHSFKEWMEVITLNVFRSEYLFVYVFMFPRLYITHT